MNGKWEVIAGKCGNVWQIDIKFSKLVFTNVFESFSGLNDLKFVFCKTSVMK